VKFDAGYSVGFEMNQLGFPSRALDLDSLPGGAVAS